MRPDHGILAGGGVVAPGHHTAGHPQAAALGQHLGQMPVAGVGAGFQLHSHIHAQAAHHTGGAGLAAHAFQRALCGGLKLPIFFLLHGHFGLHGAVGRNGHQLAQRRAGVFGIAGDPVVQTGVRRGRGLVCIHKKISLLLWAVYPKEADFMYTIPFGPAGGTARGVIPLPGSRRPFRGQRAGGHPAGWQCPASRGARPNRPWLPRR